ncbi:MAG TPA: VCBS repeat-containing protein, partial [Caulobacteraceae bacterium]|nr:VCBS repeat-containing protein [Caulobacteraceae bacterium]
MINRRWVPCITVLAGLLAAGAAFGDVGVTFQDVAAGGASGLSYGRVPSERLAISEAIRADGVLVVEPEYPGSPYKPHGAPGVAVLDYDGDGDQDLYVTNGPGAANSLFRNLLAQTGQLQFVDVAAAAGVAATDQDSQGVCYGDIDNDGDPDLMVLGSSEPNRLFENQGDGTFQDITAASGAGGSNANSVSCAMGDVNADGLLDIYVANAFDFIKTDIFVLGPEFFYHQPDQLLLNQGGNDFADVSEASGIRDIADLSQPGAAMLTWATSLVDFDLDGDLDIVVTHDNRSLPPFLPPQNFVRVFANNGAGFFNDATAALKLDRDGSWRGLSFADFDCNRRLDLFATNFGDYVFFPGFYEPGTWASRLYLQGGDGTFTAPGPGDLVTIPGGWGTSTADYDNDGDFDVIAYGNEETSLFWENSNPGVILQNQGLCSGELGWDAAALAGSTDHTRRTVNGVATGDLNLDGFVDIV